MTVFLLHSLSADHTGSEHLIRKRNRKEIIYEWFIIWLNISHYNMG